MEDFSKLLKLQSEPQSTAFCFLCPHDYDDYLQPKAYTVYCVVYEVVCPQELETMDKKHSPGSVKHRDSVSSIASCRCRRKLCSSSRKGLSRIHAISTATWCRACMACLRKTMWSAMIVPVNDNILHGGVRKRRIRLQALPCPSMTTKVQVGSSPPQPHTCDA